MECRIINVYVDFPETCPDFYINIVFKISVQIVTCEVYFERNYSEEYL